MNPVIDLARMPAISSIWQALFIDRGKNVPLLFKNGAQSGRLGDDEGRGRVKGGGLNGCADGVEEPMATLFGGFNDGQDCAVGVIAAQST